MANYLSALVQILFFTCGPLAAFGVLVYLCRALYIALMGQDEPFRSALIFTLAPSTPLRVLGNAMMAILFGHHITDICFLNVRDPDGELGFVDRSYNPRNPVAVLGHFFYALGPAILGLAFVFAVCLACFGDTLPHFVDEIAALAKNGGDIFDYLDATWGVIPAMFATDSVGVFGKILGCLLILMVCMGVFVSVKELVESFVGLILYAVLASVCTAVLMLFDARVQRIVLGGLHGFASLVTALNLIVLLGVAVFLALGALVCLYRFLFGKPTTDTAVMPYEKTEYPPERR